MNPQTTRHRSVLFLFLPCLLVLAYQPRRIMGSAQAARKPGNLAAKPGQGLPKGTTSKARPQPCWEEVGISKNVMDQRQSIAAETRSQIAAVCAQAGLSDQQKREQIRQIHQAAQSKLDAVFPAAMREKLRACQQKRASAVPHPGGGGHQPGVPHPGGGPCAQFSTK